MLHGARHQFSAPSPHATTARSRDTNRILAEEFLYARTWTSETQRAEALKIWNIHFNYHRPHSAAAGQPPASRLTTGVTNLRASHLVGKCQEAENLASLAKRFSR